VFTKTLMETRDSIRHTAQVIDDSTVKLSTHYQQFRESIDAGAALQKTHLDEHLKAMNILVDDQRNIMQAVSDMVLDVHLNGRARSLAASKGGAS
jgi:hypothetical protein